jgi:hypothetical protein
MPLPMIHLSVVRNFAEYIKPENSQLFFLGSISPDSIHMRVNTGKEDKQKTHYIGETREKTIENVRSVL